MIITKSLLNITNPEQQLLFYHNFFAKIEKDIPQKLNHIITIEFDSDAAIDFVHLLIFNLSAQFL
ncbi:MULTISPECIES: hypothetical protein [Sulfurimonas]|uniref:hypothetical protein n=1 Tax=Sulfurimonas TaxID=202746 RepID=UPI00125EA147|nr:hypothetical protein [Sulfurimonas hydrogeniphila]